ncbi:hypothetical protein [Phocaeicola massiliensis]|jgi:hypothetical protein|uniref:Uncharacterized protein n=1 Tax=Phocaeicola massiliensis B84634 = Timone 84634 = DSM 17679 = JCM 13223 TaxID=1121098 RepID=U6RST8_9BACT|nr:hypothetical protein [Phocaeicola massiliensis]EOA58313.1 hypothetical protein HMPREF1534_00279 [Phocaeicola massiliensis B84634 = Timone 84634 = DSM 17679 = JCM 13223]MDQ7675015.1 tape measure domain-containing protein [Phocaeicola massiliensis]DAE39299.1 MAG TPA: tail tape measure protein [Caudoviricetes sp.]
MEPIKLEIFMKDLTRAGLRSVAKNIDGVKQNTLSVIALLEKELAEMQAKAKLAAEQGVVSPKQMADIQAMTGMVKGLKEELAELEKQKKAGHETLVVDDKATAGMDKAGRTAANLKLQFTQVAHELPSLALSPQMFILAISNNLPMLTEAIANVRKENELLRASGQKAVPVWKQLGKALLSPQTALIVGITLFIAHGKEITAWVKKMLGAKEEALSMAEAQKKLNEGYRESTGTVAGQVLAYQKLKDKWKELGTDADKQQKFIRASKGEFERLGVSVDSVREAENLLIGNTDAFIAALKKRAQAGAADELAKDAYKKYLQAESRGAEEAQREMSLGDVILAGIGTYDADTMMEDFEKQKEKRIQGYKEEAAVWLANYNSYYDKSRELNRRADEDLKKAGIRKKVTEDPDPERNTGKSALDYRQELADARIRAQQKLEAARIAVMTEGYKKRKAIARRELDEEIAGIDRTERETLQKMQEARKKKGVKITPEEEQGVKDTARLNRLLATEKYIKEYYDIEKEWQDKNIQSWIDYNKEYGTYQQKRLAVTREYNLKMMQEGLTEGERASLGKELEADLRELNMKEFKNSIDFAGIFGDLDAQGTEALAVLRDKLKEFINNSAKDLKPDDLKNLQDAFKDIDFEIKGRQPFRELKKDLADYRTAQAEVEKAQTELNQVQKFGSLIIEEYDEETGEVTRRLLTQKEAEDKLTAAQKKRKEALSGLVKSMSGVSSEISRISDAANSIISTFDMLGVEVGEDIRGMVEGFGAMSEGINNVVSAAQNGDIAGMIAGALGSAGGVIKTFGSLFGADFGGEKSRKRYEEAKEKYESYMDVLDQVISKQKELVASMEADDFANADNSYEKARELLRKQQDYAREMGKAYLNSGASKGVFGIGSSASEGTKQRKNISSSAWEQARKALGSDFTKISDGRMTGLFDLTYEQLVKLRDEASVFWGELHQDTQEYLNQIIESEEAWQEVQESRKEALTKMDFDSFYDSFVSTLSDLDATSEDFARNFEKYLQNAIFSALVAGKYKKDIESLYASWADMAESDKELNDKEADALRETYDRIVKDMMEERERIMKDFGWSAPSSSSSQAGRSGAISNITEETGNELVGIGNNMLDKMISFGILLEELKKGREADSAVFAEIAANTAYCKMLEPLLEIMKRWEANRFKITM